MAAGAQGSRSAGVNALWQFADEFLQRKLKRAVKNLYRRPVIELARVWRGRLARPCFIGITGSAGKTTTKDLLCATLAQRNRCIGNTGSHNQIYNIARTLLAVRPRTQFCVQEVGLHRPGGFSPMVALLRPQVGIVTNIGQDHLDAFHSPATIAAEKARLIEQLPASGLAVLNADDPHVIAMAARTRARVVTYSLGGPADYCGEVLQARWPARLSLRVSYAAESARIDTQLCGAHQAASVLAAVAASHALGARWEDAAAAIGAHEPRLGRLSVQHTRRGATFLRDDLKAPEWSLEAVWEFMRQAQAPRKLIVLGTISDSEASPDSIYQHAIAGALSAADYVVWVGEHGPASAARWGGEQTGRLQGFATARAAADWLATFVQSGDLVLLKGSMFADHLARLALSMDQEVGCWRRHCPRHIFCDHCRWLRLPMAP